MTAECSCAGCATTCDLNVIRPAAAGAELMYCGGTVIEVALAAAVMTHWYLVSGRALARTRRRSESVGLQLPIALPSRRRGWAPLPLSHLDRISRSALTGHKRTPRVQ
jgi:hypothetical protein